jgi:hypothetical protein
MTDNNDLQPLKITEKEEEFIRVMDGLTRILQDNIKILAMIEEILETPLKENESHLDLLIERIERGNNQ